MALNLIREKLCWKSKDKMRIDELMAGFAETSLTEPVLGLTLDSREVKSGYVFIALAGAKQHGLEYAGEVLKQGASAIIYAPEGQGDDLAAGLKDIPLIKVEQLAFKLADIAARFYDYPTQKLDIIGITGTNGKTTCSQFLAQVFNDSGVIGTLGWGQWGVLKATVNTTPSALLLQQILAEFVKEDKRTVFMEVSSHGLEQSRVKGIDFKGAVFTNLSRDHLDYHGSMERYFQAKLALFKNPKLEFAVINLEDAYSQRIIDALSASVKLWTFSAIGKNATVYAQAIQLLNTGLSFEVCYGDEKTAVFCAIYGEFNVENILATITTLLVMGVSLSEACEKVSTLKTISGRMQRFGKENTPQVFVDYAHTPDALDKALSALKQHKPRQLSVVFGCGGDRDQGKRAQMGKIACEQADNIIITDDNPRTESGEIIIKAILEGCEGDKAVVIRDRKQAIEKAIKQASNEDYILIAGKGHEDYQEINGIRHSFSDQTVVKQALQIGVL